MDIYRQKPVAVPLKITSDIWQQSPLPSNASILIPTPALFHVSEFSARVNESMCVTIYFIK